MSNKIRLFERYVLEENPVISCHTYPNKEPGYIGVLHCKADVVKVQAMQKVFQGHFPGKLCGTGDREYDPQCGRPTFNGLYMINDFTYLTAFDIL